LKIKTGDGRRCLAAGGDRHDTELVVVAVMLTNDDKPIESHYWFRSRPGFFPPKFEGNVSLRGGKGF